jgi:hypothetical protein
MTKNQCCHCFHGSVVVDVVLVVVMLNAYACVSINVMPFPATTPVYTSGFSLKQSRKDECGQIKDAFTSFICFFILTYFHVFSFVATFSGITVVVDNIGFFVVCTSGALQENYWMSHYYSFMVT